MDLSDKNAVVTGGARGIGLAISRAFIHAGATVMMVDIDEQELEAAHASLGDHQVARTSFCDVSSAGGVADLAKSARKSLGRVDILVNNVGIRQTGAIEEHTNEMWDSSIRVNLTSAFLCTRAFIPLLERPSNEGATRSIINIASVAGLVGRRNRVAYSTAKSAVLGLTMSCAYELGSKGIRVNAIAPGIIRTQLTHHYFDSEETAAKIVGSIPLGRAGDVQDVASAALFLASDASNYISGVVLPVDGGWRSGKDVADAVRSVELRREK